MKFIQEARNNEKSGLIAFISHMNILEIHFTPQLHRHK